MRIVVMFVLMTSACAAIPAYVPRGPAPVFPVEIAVEPDGVVTLDGVLEACDVWADLGVRCVPARDLLAAGVVIVTTDQRTCPQAEGGGHKHAVTLDKRITVLSDCFLVGSGVDRPLLRRILAHELGHAFGIGHLPRTCRPGESICGEALMNAEPELGHLTPTDARAFEAMRQSH